MIGSVKAIASSVSSGIHSLSSHVSLELAESWKAALDIKVECLIYSSNMHFKYHK